MASFSSAEMASHERMRREQHTHVDSPPSKRMHAVWRAVWWLLLVNVVVFWGLTGIIAVL